MSSTARKRQDARGDATRERLVTAAVDLFGSKGFEGVGARELTGAAGVPLASLPYHFKSKEMLYRAAMERIRTELAEALAPAMAEARSSLTGGRAEAEQALRRFQGALLDVLGADPKSASWAKLLIREHFDPDLAFDLVYEDAGKGAIEMLAALIAASSGREPGSRAVLIEGFARMGEVLVFRITQEAVRRRLGWESFGLEQAADIKHAMRWTVQGQAD